MIVLANSLMSLHTASKGGRRREEGGEGREEGAFDRVIQYTHHDLDLSG